jgi:hypothetical protein
MKYLFDDVYMTKQGRWASPLKPKGLFSTISPDSYPPINIDFLSSQLNLSMSFKKRSLKFPCSLYRKGWGITVHYGYYVEDLFKIRKATRLKFDYLLN